MLLLEDETRLVGVLRQVARPIWRVNCGSLALQDGVHRGH
jgi:hypothetical protein